MEISNKDKKLLVYLLAVVIIAAAYVFGAKPFLDKQAELVEETENLQNQVNHYSQIHNAREKYEAKTEQDEARYQEEIKKFFPGLDQESTIVLIKDIENGTNVWISKVAFQETQILVGTSSSDSGEVTDADDSAAPSSSLSGVKQDLSIDYSASYPDFKKLLDRVKNNGQRLYISSLSATYSVDTGRVTGNLTLSQYALEGSGIEKEAPDLSGVGIGVENIFTSDSNSGVVFGTVENNTEENGTIENTGAAENPETIEDLIDAQNAENEEGAGGEENPEQPAEPSKPKAPAGGII